VVQGNPDPKEADEANEHGGGCGRGELSELSVDGYEICAEYGFNLNCALSLVSGIVVVAPGELKSQAHAVRIWIQIAHQSSTGACISPNWVIQ